MVTSRISGTAAKPGQHVAGAPTVVASALQRYGAALLLALAALGLAQLFHGPLAGAHCIFALGAVSLAALVGGIGPGILALALCAAGLSLLFSMEIARMAAFLLVGGVEALAAGFLRQGYSEAQRDCLGERFLSEASRAISEAIDRDATLSRVAELAVPFLGDLCVAVVDEDGHRARGIAVAASDPARAARVRETLERSPTKLTADRGVGGILRSRPPEIPPEVTPEALVTEGGEASEAGPLGSEVVRRLEIRSYIGVPLVARGHTLGAMGFGITEGTRRHGDRDLALARELAARSALALDSARLYGESQEAARSRDEVLALVAHDLRAPLSSLKVSAHVLRRMVPSDGPPQLVSACDTVRSATDRLARLAEDLVDFTQLERGPLPIERLPHEPEALARDAFAVAEPLAVEHGVAISLEVAPGLASVSCDRRRVLQVLASLIGNALKVMRGSGAIRISVQGDGDAVRFTVADTGPGISDEDLPHVFDRDWRGRGVPYKGIGIGIGLAIGKSIVTAHGGRIWVESAPGRGAMFHFTMPVDTPTRAPP